MSSEIRLSMGSLIVYRSVWLSPWIFLVVSRSVEMSLVVSPGLSAYLRIIPVVVAALRMSPDLSVCLWVFLVVFVSLSLCL